MFRINLKFALRNLLRFKTYSILNIIGLSIGLALGIFVMLYTDYGFGYDRIHVNNHRMYKLLAFIKQSDKQSFTNRSNSALLGEALKQENSEIESYNRIAYRSIYFKKENSPLSESGIYADANFFSFYNFPIVQGNPTTVLNDPDGMMISEKLAAKLFGNNPPTGQQISVLVDKIPAVFKITGIFKDIEHSSMDFEFVIPFSSFLSSNPWTNSITSTSCEYVFLLKPKTDVNHVNKKIKHFLDGKDNTSSKELFLQPLSEINLYSYQNGQRQMAQLLVITIISVIGGLILLISAFNFINMAIAIGIKRNREAGIKKILGSSRFMVVVQFITESVIIALVALFLAFILLETFLPFYNQIDNIHLKVEYSKFGQMLKFISFAVGVGVLASLYPALLLAGTSPVKVLKGFSGNRQRIGFSRQGLIVFQFVVTLILLVGLFVFNEQANYVKTKDIGLDRQNVLFFSVSPDIVKHRSTFHSELISLPEVASVSWNNQVPLKMHSSTTNVLWEGKQADEKMDFWTLATDSAFMNTFKPKLAEGRFFSTSLSSDSANFIVNEEAISKMHLKDPVGKIITVDNRKGSIVGVIRNFNSHQLMVPYLPVILRYRPEETNMVFLRYNGDKNVVEQKVSAIYKKYEAYIPFESKLLDVAYNDFNRFATNSFMVMGILSLLAIFLACMGLFGLASFTIETRTKEIGIRKSSGASTLSILRLFLKTYNKWILVASCIALPIAFFVWNMIVNMIFTFRSPYPMWALILAPILVVLISWSTVIWQSWKAANKNPVEALRYE